MATQDDPPAPPSPAGLFFCRSAGG